MKSLHVDSFATGAGEHTGTFLFGMLLLLPMWRLDYSTACVYSTLIVPALYVGLHPAVAVQSYVSAKLLVVGVLLYGTVCMIERWEFPSINLVEDVKPHTIMLGSFPSEHDLMPTGIPIHSTVPAMQSKQLAISSFGVYEAQGRRPYMEDRHVIKKDVLGDYRSGPCGFCAVYDGHNGEKCADIAAKHLHERFVDEYLQVVRTCSVQMPAEQRMRRAFECAFEKVDAAVLNSGIRAGSTALGIVCYDGVLYSANAGDTRAVLARKSNKDGLVAIRLSDDHKPNLPDESVRIISAGGNVEFRAGCWRVTHSSLSMALAVSRALGDRDFKRPYPLVSAVPDVRSHTLTEEDSFVILASDGLWDVMTDEKAVKIAEKEMEAVFERQGSNELAAATAARTLTNSALEMGSEDNITVVVAMISS